MRQILCRRLSDSPLDPVLKNRDCAELPVQFEEYQYILTIVVSNIFFTLDRVKASKINDRKHPCINQYRGVAAALRSLIY